MCFAESWLFLCVFIAPQQFRIRLSPEPVEILVDVCADDSCQAGIWGLVLQDTLNLNYSEFAHLSLCVQVFLP